MVDAAWQQMHDLLMSMVEEARSDDNEITARLHQILVRLHALYPEVAFGETAVAERDQAMRDIHEVITQGMEDILECVNYRPDH